MKIGDLVKLKGDDIRGTAPGGDSHIIPAGTMGIVAPPYHLDSIHNAARPFVKLFGLGGTRPFLAHDLEVINESR